MLHLNLSHLVTTLPDTAQPLHVHSLPNKQSIQPNKSSFSYHLPFKKMKKHKHRSLYEMKSTVFYKQTNINQITRVTLTPAYNPATSSRPTTIARYALLIG